MSSLVRNLAWNPILARELRSRMRSRRAPVMVTVFLVLVGGIAYLAYSSIATTRNNPFTRSSSSAGFQLFATLTSAVMTLVVLLTPGISAGQITSERERQTFDLLLCTRMGPGRIVIGKLLSALLFVLLLIIATIPLFSVVFLIGGISAGDVAALVALMLMTALLVGAIGMFWTTVLRRTTAAMLASYVSVFVLAAAPIITSSTSNTQTFGPGGPVIEGPGPVNSVMQAFSPVTATTAALIDVDNQGCRTGVRGISSSFSPGLGTTFATIQPNQCRSSYGSFSVTAFAAGGSFSSWSVWEATLLVDGVAVVVLLGASILLLRGRRPRRRQAPSWTDEA